MSPEFQDETRDRRMDLTRKHMPSLAQDAGDRWGKSHIGMDPGLEL